MLWSRASPATATKALWVFACALFLLSSAGIGWRTHFLYTGICFTLGVVCWCYSYKYQIHCLRGRGLSERVDRDVIYYSLLAVTVVCSPALFVGEQRETVGLMDEIGELGTRLEYMHTSVEVHLIAMPLNVQYRSLFHCIHQHYIH